jgi:hypothetical protein
VQAGGRLVENVDAALLGHVSDLLEPLPLTTGQCGERLTESQVQLNPPSFEIGISASCQFQVKLERGYLESASCRCCRPMRCVFRGR